jgi:hypothetical protein
VIQDVASVLNVVVLVVGYYFLVKQGGPIRASLGMNDLVKAVEEIPGNATERNGRRRGVSGAGGGNGPA